MPKLESCSCGATRKESLLICSRCGNSYAITREQLNHLYDSYLEQKVSRIKNGDLYAAEQLIHYYESIDPQVSEIIRALRDLTQSQERSYDN